MDRGNLAIHFFRRHAELVLPPTFQRSFAQPEYIGPKGRRHQRQLILMRGNLTTFYENLLVERNPDRLSSLAFCGLRLDVERFDGFDIGPFVRR